MVPQRALCLGLLLCGSTAAMADEAGSGIQCYDAAVIARAVEQIPSEIPECGDCIIMEWPWFLDLQVKRVISGQVQGKLIRVLSVQHTWKMPRDGTWRLRKNSLGGFNVVLFWKVRPRRCPANAAPADPYIRPRNGRTLDDLRQDGERLYGRMPDAMRAR